MVHRIRRTDHGVARRVAIAAAVGLGGLGILGAVSSAAADSTGRAHEKRGTRVADREVGK